MCASIRLLVIAIHMLELVDGVMAVVAAAIALMLVSSSSWICVYVIDQLSTDLNSSTTAWALHVLSSMMVLAAHSYSILGGELRLKEQGLIMARSTHSSIRKATEIRTSMMMFLILTSISERRLRVLSVSSICQDQSSIRRHQRLMLWSTILFIDYRPISSTKFIFFIVMAIIAHLFRSRVQSSIKLFAPARL